MFQRRILDFNRLAQLFKIAPELRRGTAQLLQRRVLCRNRLAQPFGVSPQLFQRHIFDFDRLALLFKIAPQLHRPATQLLHCLVFCRKRAHGRIAVRMQALGNLNVGKNLRQTIRIAGNRRNALDALERSWKSRDVDFVAFQSKLRKLLRTISGDRLET